MNEQTAALISQLAAKLGTTADNLWAVLIHQAPISAATDILQYIAVGVAIWMYQKWLRANWDDLGDGAAVFAIIGGVALAIAGLTAFFCFPNTVAAIANPDYWALKEVLSYIRTK